MKKHTNIRQMWVWPRKLGETCPSHKLGQMHPPSFSLRTNGSHPWMMSDCTTGDSPFAMCQGHTAKPQKPTAKVLPCAAHGKGHTANSVGEIDNCKFKFRTRFIMTRIKHGIHDSNILDSTYIINMISENMIMKHIWSQNTYGEGEDKDWGVTDGSRATHVTAREGSGSEWSVGFEGITLTRI